MVGKHAHTYVTTTLVITRQGTQLHKRIARSLSMFVLVLSDENSCTGKWGNGMNAQLMSPVLQKTVRSVTELAHDRAENNK